MARRIYLSPIGTGSSYYFYSDQKGFTMSHCKLSDPEPITEYVTVPGRLKGPLDMSAALTDGVLEYNQRTLSVTLECSTGTRATRQTLLKELYTKLMGCLCQITLPDNSNFLRGRVKLGTEVNDNAHLIVSITAICEPYFYGPPITIPVPMYSEYEYFTFQNSSLLPIQPSSIVVKGSGSMEIKALDGSWSYTLSAGTYFLPELIFPVGFKDVFLYKGDSTITCTMYIDEQAEAL